MACFDEFEGFSSFFRRLSHRLLDSAARISPPFAPAWMSESKELSDVDDTASGTDWLMLNSQQYLMHCLQHRKKRHKAQLLQCASGPARRAKVNSVRAGVSFIFNEPQYEPKRSLWIFEVVKRLFQTFFTKVFSCVPAKPMK